MPACCRAQHSLSAAAGPFALPNAAPHYAPDLALEPSHLRMDLKVDAAEKRVRGRAEWTVRANRGGARELVLDAVDFAHLAVLPDPAQPLSWRYDGTHLHLCFDQGVDADDTRVITLEWTVERPLTGMLFGGPSPARPDAPLWFASDHETERARCWLPCVDHPSVRATLDISLTGPTEHVLVGPGALASDEDHGDGTHTARWQLDFPCPSYLLCVLGGDLVSCEGGSHGQLPVRFYGPRPYTEADLGRSFGRTAEMLAWMEGRLGQPCPWPKYFQFAVPGIGGAMENCSLVSWDDAWIMTEDLAPERQWLCDLINVHEMAHTWFGDAIVCRDFAHVWLKESWATYMESVWLGDTYGEPAMARMLLDEKRAYLAEADGQYQRPIVTRTMDSSWMMFDRHLYPGGAWRLHMLRRLLGETDFWAGVQTYVQQSWGDVVETDDFRRVLERQSGRSLARFFDQWLKSPGYPDLGIKYARDKARGRASLSLRQQQYKADKPHGPPAFHFDLDVAVQSKDGDWARYVLEVRGARATLAWDQPEAPAQVVLDPDGKVLFKVAFAPGDDLLKTTLREGPSVYARAQAASDLAALGRRPHIQALLDAAKTETDPGVREAIVRALGTVGSETAALGLAGLLPTETEPRTLLALLGALGKTRLPAVQAAVVEWLGVAPRGPLATAAALSVLGNQRGQAPTDVIEGYLDHAGPWGHERRGALHALGASRKAAAIEVLKSAAADTSRLPQVRIGAMGALAASARVQSRGTAIGAREVLEDLCRDPHYGVRMAAVRGLGTLGHRAGLGAVQRARALLATQDLPRVERVQRALAKSGSGSKDKRIEALEDELKALRARVEGLEGR